MKQLQHSYYFWKTPRKNKKSCINQLSLKIRQGYFSLHRFKNDIGEIFMNSLAGIDMGRIL
ncbi:hypothetical protein UZS20_24745, partial [Escherichia coli]|nr:hypothetical protein [Escherichia coli]